MTRNTNVRNKKLHGTRTFSILLFLKKMQASYFLYDSFISCIDIYIYTHKIQHIFNVYNLVSLDIYIYPQNHHYN